MLGSQKISPELINCCCQHGE